MKMQLHLLGQVVLVTFFTQAMYKLPLVSKQHAQLYKNLLFYMKHYWILTDALYIKAH